MSENEKDIKITLFSNYILIDMKKKKETKVVIPETVRKPIGGGNFDAIVVKVSQERTNVTPETLSMPMVKNIKVGDNVCLSSSAVHSGQVVMMHKKEFFIVRETEVVGVFLEGYDEDDEELKLVISKTVN